MKIIITENKFKEGILKYINSMFDINDIGWTYGIDDWGNEVGYAIEFYSGDYEEGGSTLFRWYGEDYWVSEESSGWGNIKEKKLNSPILEFEDEQHYNNLQGLFGNLWKPLFIEWFWDKFHVPVKTIN